MHPMRMCQLDTLNAVVQVKEGPAPKAVFFIVPVDTTVGDDGEPIINLEIKEYVRMDLLSPSVRQMIRVELKLQ